MTGITTKPDSSQSLSIWHVFWKLMGGNAVYYRNGQLRTQENRAGKSRPKETPKHLLPRNVTPIAETTGKGKGSYSGTPPAKQVVGNRCETPCSIVAHYRGIMAMSRKRDRFDKVMAVAINPGAFEAEAVAALRRARDLVKGDPSLAYPPAEHGAGEASFQTTITNVSRFWLPIIMSNLSSEGYGLGLKSKIVTGFRDSSYAIDVRCDGSTEACQVFKTHLDWLISFVNCRPMLTSA